MIISFLGTGTSQGVPVINCSCAVCKSPDPHDIRLRSSIHLATNSVSLVVDTGPDFRQQMLKTHVPHIDALLFTHEHKDHTAGLDDIRPYYLKTQKAISFYARPKVIDQLKREYAYIFAKKRYPGIPDLKPYPIYNNQPFEIKDLTVIPIEVLHYQLPVFGFRFGNFTYVTDASFIDEQERTKIIGSKILVINALRNKKHPAHFNLEEALKVIADLEPKQAYLTHISHLMGKSRDVNKDLPPHVRLAYDGLQVRL